MNIKLWMLAFLQWELNGSSLQNLEILSLLYNMISFFPIQYIEFGGSNFALKFRQITKMVPSR